MKDKYSSLTVCTGCGKEFKPPERAYLLEDCCIAQVQPVILENEGQNDFDLYCIECAKKLQVVKEGEPAKVTVEEEKLAGTMQEKFMQEEFEKREKLLKQIKSLSERQAKLALVRLTEVPGHPPLSLREAVDIALTYPTQ